MILGRDAHPASACFDELDRAITALRAPSDPPVCLNAHAFPSRVPVDAIVYNLETVGSQISPDAFPDHEVWDFSLRNLTKWSEGRRTRPVTYVPIGYHASMRRFTMRPWEERDIDVVFTGQPCLRRSLLLEALASRGYRVVAIGTGEAYGLRRDEILARSKLSLNALYYPGGLFPSLRAAHAVANGLPVLNERTIEMPEWALHVAPYENLVEVACTLLSRPAQLCQAAELAARMFQARPLILPAKSSWTEDARLTETEDGAFHA